jgi:hypothetical protein
VQDLGDGRFSAAVGSQFEYRMFGALLAAGRRQLPIRVTLAITETSQDARYIVVVLEGVGWYLWSIRAHDRAFETRCDEILTSLRTGVVKCPARRPWRSWAIIAGLVIVVAVVLAAYFTYPTPK